MEHTLQNCETDTTGLFWPTDHYPRITTLRLKLNATKPKEKKTRPKFEDPDPDQQLDYNDSFQQALKTFLVKQR